jgi:hypothetical protein
VSPFQETVRDHKRFNAVAAADKFEEALPGFKDEKDLKGFIGWVLRGTPGTKSNTPPGSNRPSPTPTDPCKRFHFRGESFYRPTGSLTSYTMRDKLEGHLAAQCWPWKDHTSYR